MKKLPYILLSLLAACGVFAACSDNDENKELEAWIKTNNEWLVEQQGKKNADGTPYYQVVVPKWNPSSFVLMHYFNTRTSDPNALTPLYTSTVDVRYHLSLYDGTPCDSSSLMTTYGPGIYRAQLNDLIDGWAASVCNMNVGDTAEVIIPWTLGYGTSASGSIPACSNLKFNIRLTDIVLYEISPEEEPSDDE